MAADRIDPLRIGIAGLGTVGAGVVRLLTENRDVLQLHCPRPIEVVAVSARDRAKDRGIDISKIDWVESSLALASHPRVDVVVELIGGSDGPAKALVEAAIANGRHVVTANKALLAHHGTALAVAAEGKNLCLAYEAAVAGGIPVIKAMREGLAANRIEQVYGILNGT
jgi:homoserine dehydrogenase